MMEKRIFRLMEQAKAEGCFGIEKYEDSVISAKFNKIGFQLDMEEFSFLVAFRGSDMVLIDLDGDNDPNHPLLKSLGITEEDLQDLNDSYSEGVIIDYEKRFAYLLAVGLEKSEQA